MVRSGFNDNLKIVCQNQLHTEEPITILWSSHVKYGWTSEQARVRTETPSNNHQQLRVSCRKAQENMLTAARPIGHARIDIWNGFSSRPLTSTQMMRERSTQNSYDWERRSGRPAACHPGKMQSVLAPMTPNITGQNIYVLHRIELFWICLT